jgi:hypothetical protein
MYMIWAAVLIGSLFLGMLILLETGRRIGLYRFKTDPEGSQKGISTVESAVFGLLGLFIAFTFSGALTRWDTRRVLITDEVNAIGTAFLRIDLLPADKQPEMKDLFRHYLDTRIETYKNVENKSIFQENLELAARMQNEIWTQAINSSNHPGANADAAKLILPALNEMIDITTTRVVANQTHPPRIIYYLLYLMSLLGALLAGYGMSESKTRNFLHMVVFATIVSITVYVILDIEYPRQGLFRIDTVDQALTDLRKSMG